MLEKTGSLVPAWQASVVLGPRELFRGRCMVLGDVSERVSAEAATPCP